MTALLLYDDALRSREVRHELGEPVGDPVAFIEVDGRRIVVGSVLDEATFAAREDVVDEYWTFSELGAADLVDDASIPEHVIGLELVRRALERAGASSVVVPPAFSLAAGDYLRAHGVDVDVDAETWARRRRRKSPAELEGTERAQRAAETAMLTAARMLREAEPTTDGRLRFSGEILTAELMREAMSAELLAQGAESEDILIHSGDACLDGHALGRGPIAPDASCIVDVFPRDRRSGAFTDMTRTFVAGTPSDELVRLHADCRAALDIALECVEPGSDVAFARVAGFFESKGWPTQRTHDHRTGPLREGFSHGLGHGVGLEVHEPPSLGRRADRLLAGDVIALEPGLYVRGIGGVRLEDTVLVTDGGPQRFTDPFPYDLRP
jgi:Xaa-Pro aminopeptidase